MVDWTATLWPASFRGVPFLTEQVGAACARRVVSHEFPRRDEPFHEDLGLGVRRHEITAYVASDAVLAEAASLAAAFALPGPGVLVLPGSGPVLARCTEWRRADARDEMGKVAFTATLVEEGAAAALVSLGLLASLAVSAAAALAGAADGIAARIEPAGVGGLLREEAAEGLRDVAAALDVIRDTNAVAPAVSASVRDALSAYYDAVPGLIGTGAQEPASAGAVAGAGAPLVEAARALGDGMDHADAARAFGAMASVAPLPPVAAGTPVQQARARNAQRVDRVARLAALAACAEALVRTDYPSRREGVAARAAAVELFALAIADLGGAENVPALAAVIALRDRTVQWLSRAITDLRPVVTVSAATELPALWWAWRLYADPTRAGEIVARNRLSHPQFVPSPFEALAPS